MLLFAVSSIAVAQSGDPLIFLSITDKNGNTGSSVEIVEGEEITLVWIGQNVEDCKIMPGNIAADDMNLATPSYDGLIKVTPDEDSMDFVIKCQGVSDSVQVTPVPVVTIDVDYSAVELAADGSLSREPTISWTSEHVSSCRDVKRKTPGANFRGWKYHIGPNTSGDRTDNNMVGTGVYEYQLTCTGINGQAVSAGTQVEVTGVAQEASFTLTASPAVITANKNGEGAVAVSWSGKNISGCNWRVYHDSPSIPSKSSARSGDRSSGTVNFALNEQGEHQFRLWCTSAVNGERIDQIATATLSYAGVDVGEPGLTLTADPTIITLTATNSIQRTELTWGGGLLSSCARYMQRKAPSDTDFRNFTGAGSISGSKSDYQIVEPGTYTYSLTCYSAVDGSAITATEDVVVAGDNIVVSEVRVTANPTVVTPDPSTGLASTTLTWSYVGLARDYCSWLDYQSPSVRANNSNYFPALDPAPNWYGSAGGNSGVTVHDTIDEYGTWKYRLYCRHPITRDRVTAIEEVRVEMAGLLPSNISLNATLINNRIEVEYKSENYTSCSAIEKKVLGGSWFEFSDLSENVNTSGRVIDSSTLTSGTYSYRMTCERPIEGRNDTIVAEVTYTTPPVTGTASVGFAQCRNSAGYAISIPDGYMVDVSGNCVLAGVLGDIDLSFDAPLIRAGDSAEISWEYTGTYVFDTCFLQGPGIIDPNTGNTTNDLLVNVTPGLTGSAQTDPRYEASLYNITCTNSSMAAPLVSDKIRLEVVPTYQEV